MSTIRVGGAAAALLLCLATPGAAQPVITMAGCAMGRVIVGRVGQGRHGNQQRGQQDRTQAVKGNGAPDHGFSPGTA